MYRWYAEKLTPRLYAWEDTVDFILVDTYFSPRPSIAGAFGVLSVGR